eukprot:scaffold273901_cov13-Tisochrysis_lutea.AAC.1
MVATRHPLPGTPGAPLIATGRRGKVWGPSLVTIYLFILYKILHEEMQKQKKEQVSSNERPALGQAPTPSSN